MVSKKELNLDFLIVILYIILTAAFVLVPPLNESSLRTVLGIPMILFFPGYVFTTLMFPRREDLDGIERLAMSIGLSIVIIPVIGYSLNFTPWGIKLVPIMILTSFFILILCILSIIRRSLLPENEKYYLNIGAVSDSLKEVMFGSSSPQSTTLLSIILTVLILASVLSLSYIISTPNLDETFTEFYIKGKDGTLSGYPSFIEFGEDVVVIVGIVNHEYETVNYTLEIQLENKSMELPDDITHVRIAQNQTWEQMLIIEPSYTGKESELKFLLYKNENMTEPYRDLHLWINVSEENNDN